MRISDWSSDVCSSDLLVPQRGSDDHISHLEWLHFAEGSAMTPILLRIYTARLGEAAAPIEPRIAQQLDAHFAYMESRVGENGHFIGDDLSAADIMLSFPAEIAVMQGMAPRYPKLAAFVNACQDRKSVGEGKSGSVRVNLGC